MKPFKAKLFPLLSSIFGIGILVLAIWAIAVQMEDYRFQDLLAGMEGVNGWQLMAVILLTGLSYGAISGYDLLAFRYIRHGLSPFKIAFVGLVTYSISPNVGFAFLTGGALRYRLYSPWNVSALEIAEVTVFTNLSLWVGIFAIAGAVFFLAPFPLPAHIAIPLGSLQVLGGLFLAIAAVYLALAAFVRAPVQLGKCTYRLPSLKLAIGQIGVFGFDWGCASAALYVLLDLQESVAFPQFFCVYVVALGLGLLSTVPGGLGVFETVMLFFLTQFSDEPTTLGRLLVFRGIYYFLPFILAVSGLGIYELRRSMTIAARR